MNTRTAIRRIKKYRPTTPAEFKDAGVPLGRLVGSGVFREVVRVKGCDLVVKFPLDDGGYRDGRMHTTVELRKLKKLAEYPWMRRYLPKVHYHDPKSGVLVMRYYPRFKNYEDQIEGLGNLIRVLLRRITGVNISDIHCENIRNGTGPEPENYLPILCDLGY